MNPGGEALFMLSALVGAGKHSVLARALEISGTGPLQFLENLETKYPLPFLPLANCLLDLLDESVENPIEEIQCSTALEGLARGELVIAYLYLDRKHKQFLVRNRTHAQYIGGLLKDHPLYAALPV